MKYAKGEMDQQTASIAKYLTCEKVVEVGHEVKSELRRCFLS